MVAGIYGCWDSKQLMLCLISLCLQMFVFAYSFSSVGFRSKEKILSKHHYLKLFEIGFKKRSKSTLFAYIIKTKYLKNVLMSRGLNVTVTKKWHSLSKLCPFEIKLESLACSLSLSGCYPQISWQCRIVFVWMVTLEDFAVTVRYKSTLTWVSIKVQTILLWLVCFRHFGML